MSLPAQRLPCAPTRGARSCRRLQVAALKTSQSASDGRSKLLDFTRWAIDQKIQFGGVKLETRDGNRGQTVVSVPSSCAITLTPSQQPIAGVPAQVWSDLPWWGRLAVLVALLDPKYKTYKAVLPDRVDLPVMWGATEGDVQQLQVPYMIQQVHAEQQEWDALVHRLLPFLAAKGVAEDKLRWALTIVRSRSFAGPTFQVPTKIKTGLAAALPLAVLAASNGDLGPVTVVGALAALALPIGLTIGDLQQAPAQVTYAIAPFLDMMNHTSKAGTEVSYDWLRESFSVSAGRACVVGSEVLISYGELSNDTLLQRYGFVEQDNPHDRYIMSDLATWLVQGPLAETGGSLALPQLHQAIAGVSPGLFKELELRPEQGFSQDVRVAVQSIASKVLALQQTGVGTANTTAAALAAAALRHACDAELSALGSTIEEDAQELGRYKRLAVLAGLPEPLAPPMPVVPVGIATEDGVVQEGLGSGQGVQQLSTLLTGSDAQQAQAVTVVSVGETEQAGQQLVEQESAQYMADMERYEVQQLEYQEQLAQWREAQELGVVRAQRMCTAVQYRIEKKRVLAACHERI